MSSQHELELKFCSFSYEKIAQLIEGLVTFVNPLQTIPKQEIFQTVLHDHGDKFLEIVKNA